MARLLKNTLAILLTLVVFPLAAQATELVMVDDDGCVWCARWEEEVGPAYPKSTEGQFAPLRKINIRDITDEIEVARRVNFTPTFLIVKEGRELARIEGYPGAHFFFPLVEQLLVENTDFAVAK